MATYKYNPATGTYTLSDDPFSVSTDQPDYSPGAIASITANGIEPGATVQFSVAHVDPGPDGLYGTADDKLTYDLSGTTEPWTATDGGFGDLDGVVNGVIKTAWNVGLDAAGQSFMLSATNSAAGLISTTAFTDTVTAGVTPTIDFTKIFGIAGDLPLNQPPNNVIVTAHPDEAYFTNDRTLTEVVSGSGNLESFVRISTNNLTEQGYNTSGSPLQFDENNSNQFTHNLPLAAIPISYFDLDGNGTPEAYYQFRLDINENNSATEQFLSLDKIEIWQSDTKDLHSGFVSGGTAADQTSYDPAGANPFGFTAAGVTGNYLAYNFDAGVANAANNWIGLEGSFYSGSGDSDMVLLVPITNFDTNLDWVYLYSAFGEQAGTSTIQYDADKDGVEEQTIANANWRNSGGYEEWAILSGVPASLSGSKWGDLDKDGTRDPGESGIAGWHIYLYNDTNGDGNLDTGEGLVASTVTDANGNFTFTNLPAVTIDGSGNPVGGKYIVLEEARAGWTQSFPGTDVVDTANPAGQSQFGYAVTLNPGENETGKDFGNFQLASVNGIKLLDANADGLKQAGENTPISGITINLYKDLNGDGTLQPDERDGVIDGDAQDTPFKTTTTAANGTWSFTGLDPGKYIVEEVLSGGYVTKDNVDVAITLTSGETHGVDEGTTFMNYKLASVNGIKLLDANADGLKQAGENTPISGITINLYKDLNGDGTLQADERDGVIDGDAQDTPFKTTATAADGTWSFTGLDPGKYIVEEVLSNGYVTKDNVDVAITLASGETHGVDEGTTFMNYKLASVNGIKLLDANADGLKQAGENTPISGITINLYKDLNGDGTLQADERDGVIDGDSQDTPFKTTATAADGTWSFTGLDPGKYIVEEVLSGGYVTKDNVDVAITLASGETHGVDEGTTFMNYKLASVNGIKLLDANADGLKQAGENTPISGITINLYKDLNGDGTLQADERDGVIDGDAQDTPFKTTATAADGTWSFTGLDPGKYIVEEVLSGGYVTKDNVDVAITLASGETHGVDEGTTFMNYKTASVNGIKLLDANADGLKQAGENTPISGITINLYKDLNGDGTLQPDERDGVIDGDAQDTPFKTTSTAADGTWSFTGLDPGKYIVEEVLSGGYVTKDNVDVAITLASGETHGVDEGTTFMNYKTASVNGIKLLDLDADGVHDAGENTPISGITINLYKDLNGDGTLQADERDGVIDGDAQDTPFKTTATAADGTWSFSGLDPGKYIVEEVLSGGYVTNDNVDVAITLASGETHGVDEGTTFMNYKAASVNGIKLLDADADGVKDAGENTPISGITINLYKDLNGDGTLQADERDGVIDGDAQDTPFKTTATAADGTWSFNGLDPGKYIVEEVLSGGYVTKDNVDVAITLASGETHGVDEGTTFMNYKTASVNGIKLLDADADGVKDAGENTPISGITINLYKDLNGDGTLQADERDGVIDGDAQDTPFKTTATAADGTWSFSGLDPGKYIVEEVLSNGYVTKDNVDVAITLASGETHGVDEGTTFMNYKTASVNGIKLLDADADGVKDAGENTPISGITINLYKDLNGDGTLQADERDGVIDGDAQDTPFKTTATAADGTWSFSGLDPGKYIVEEVLSNGYVTKDNVDVAITLASGETHGVDEGTTFMNYKTASVNGIKLLDADADGVHDAGENTPISGITINLYKDLNGDGVLQPDERDGVIDGDAQDTPFKTTSTAADGTWSFSGLDPGKYIVEEVLSGGYVTNDNVDVAITLASGETHGVDEGTTFMNYKAASVNGIKLLDADADGVKDAGENTPISGITINLYKDLNGDGTLQADERDGVIDGDAQDTPFKTTATAADGTWSFSGLDPGKYIVEEVLSNGYVTKDNVDVAITLASGETHGVDEGTTFMNYKTASVNGIKLLDANADGLKQAGENTPISGITINLYKDLNGDGTLQADERDGVIDGDAQDTPFKTTATAADGTWSFSGLDPGKYIVEEVLSNGYVTKDNVDVAITLASGETHGVDEGTTFMNYKTASVNGIKLLDADADGVKDAGEDTPISGITINLYKDLNGDGTLQADERDGVIDGDSQDTPFKTTATAADGTWSFSGLDPGKYIVEEVLSGGYVTKDNVDVAITLASGETHGVDEGTTFMNYKTASVNGIKLLDADADGVHDAGENTPISGITINLYKDLNGDGVLQPDERDGVIDGDAQDTPFKTTATAADGTWSFSGLDPGKYIVEEVLSGGYVTKDNVDVAITLASGETHGVDEGTTFMNYKAASVNGIKLLDANADGLKQAGENTPISGITINLYKDLNGDGTLQADERDGVIDGDSQDTPFKTTATAADGTWSFTGLDPGKYIVEEVLSGGYVTKDNVDVAITLASGETHGVDEGTTFMNYKTASVNGIKLLDANADGLKQAGENTPISGITINLYKDLNGDGTLQADERDGIIDGDSQDSPFKTTATAADGTWSFSGLDPGKYIVEEVLSNGYVTKDNVDVAITLASGETHGVDEGTTFMNYKPASVNGIKLLDANANGLKDATENTPISGITINLYKDLNGDGVLQADERDGIIDGDSQDAPFKTTSTAADGTWSFSNLDPGKYVVEEVLSNGYVTKDNVDVAITLASGETHGVDEGTTFMNYKPASVNGIKLLDLDADGIKDANENTPVSGITINLYKDLNGDGVLQADERDGVIDGDSQDSPFKTTTTAADGTWSFSGLDPGKYLVQEVLSGGYQSSDKTTIALTLASGESHGVDADTTFMNYVNGSIHGLKFNDLDADGKLDGADSPMAGITIQLKGDVDGNGTIDTQTTTTDANGHFSFENLHPGTYTISELFTDGTNWGATVDHNNDGIGDATTTVTVLSGQEVVAVAGEAGQLDSLHTEVNVGDALTFGNHQLGALGLTPGFWYNHEYVWDAPISGSDTSNGKADGKGVSLASKLAAAGTITAPDIANLLPNNPLAGGTSDVDGDNHKDLFFQGADGNLVIQWDDAQETVGAANGTGGDKLGDFVRYAVTTALNEVGVPNFNAPNGLLGDIADWLIKYGGVTKIDTNNDGTTDTFVLKYNNKHETDNPGNGQDGNVPKAKDGVSGFGYSTSVKASSAAWQTGDPAHGVPSGSQIFADMNATTDGATGSNMLVSMNQSMVLMANDNGDYFGVLGVAPNTHDGYLHLT